jgi:transposase InsO family protein
MENATGKKLQSLKTDHGGEYRSHKFLQQLPERGIQLVENVPYHSETNPGAESANLTISTMGRIAHLHSKISKELEAFGHAICTKNRIPHKSYSCPPAEASLGSDAENERGRLRPFGEPNSNDQEMISMSISRHVLYTNKLYSKILHPVTDEVT